MIVRKYPFWLAVFFCLCFATPRLEAQTWKAMGPPGGDVRSLAVDPSQPDVVFLGTTDGHIFGSQDAGGHWSLLGLASTSGNAVVTSIVVDARSPGTLYAGTWTREAYGEGGGVQLSRDAGKTWRESGLVGHAVRVLVQSPSDPDTLLAGALDGIFRSRDAGLSWEQITPEAHAELRNFDSLAVDPENDDVIYAGTFHLPWKTEDGGRHWRPIHRGMIDDSDVLSLALDAANPKRIFASACSGIYRSESAGKLWQKIQGIPYASRRTQVIRQDPSNPGTIFAGTTEGLWKSADAGATWRRVSPADWVINALVIEPAGNERDSLLHPARVLIGTEQRGVFSSDDGGETFAEANEGFRHRRILSLAINPEKQGHVAAVLANAPDSVVETSDGGETWAPLGTDSRVIGLERVFSTPAGLWGAVKSGGLVRFDSSAGRWTREGFLAGIRGMEGDGKQPFNAVVNELSFSDRAWYAATENGLYLSLDSGATWAALPFATLELPVNSARVSSDGRKLRIVSSHGMVFSDDAGSTWKWHDLPLESGGALRLELVDEDTILAVSRKGLYISHDGGTAWQKAAAGLPGVYTDDLLIRPDFWLVSIEAGGLYFSVDRGASWSRVKDLAGSGGTLAENHFPALLAEKESGLIYAGSATDGIYILSANRFLPAANAATSGR
ncbi:MAG: hypothetical protein WBP79_14980 [Candidatus Acidiferrales bacterium]